MTRRGGTRTDNRLRVLRVGALVLGAIFVLRVVQLQVFEHERWAAIAGDQWGRDVATNAERGDIFDRHGRPLALSAKSYDVGVSKAAVRDLDALAFGIEAQLGIPASDVIRRIRRAETYAYVARGIPLTKSQHQELRLLGMTMDETSRRWYPSDGVAASLIGFCRTDPEARRLSGLEMGLDELLMGEPGRSRQVRTGRAARELGAKVIVPPRHGYDVVTTLDTDLQAICEELLRKSVADCRAAGGSVLIMQPDTGDVLAAASWPLMDTRDVRHADAAVWNNRNFTHLFEPGSLFKVFSAASLLGRGAVDTLTVYNGDGKHRGIGNSDDHEYGDLGVMPALTLSNNVWFAKAAENLLPDEMRADLVNLGFSLKTALPYPGQPAGLLRRTSDWSERSRSTIAIGQEISATSLQLGAALCAVANGGTLYEPRIVREVRDHGGGVIEEVQPVPLRRVMTPPLTALLREAMGRVVQYGTGRAARLDWLPMAGKTGTAQKCIDGRGYAPNKYVASFGGMAPQENARLVILTVLDEPDWAHHYAAQSAVPLFRDIVTEIARCTTWLDGATDGGSTLQIAAASRLAPAPDVMYLSAENAARQLGAAGLAAAGAERNGTVVGQIPAPGTLCRPGQTITLTVAGRAPDATAAAVSAPDFLGLSNRQVRHLAARLGLDVKIVGTGYARWQDIAPGAAVGGPMTIRMAGSWR